MCVNSFTSTTRSKRWPGRAMPAASGLWITLPTLPRSQIRVPAPCVRRGRAASGRCTAGRRGPSRPGSRRGRPCSGRRRGSCRRTASSACSMRARIWAGTCAGWSPWRGRPGRARARPQGAGDGLGARDAGVDRVQQRREALLLLAVLVERDAEVGPRLAVLLAARPFLADRGQQRELGFHGRRPARSSGARRRGSRPAPSTSGRRGRRSAVRRKTCRSRRGRRRGRCSRGRDRSSRSRCRRTTRPSSAAACSRSMRVTLPNACLRSVRWYWQLKTLPSGSMLTQALVQSIGTCGRG
jgi:hypothetical protein